MSALSRSPHRSPVRRVLGLWTGLAIGILGVLAAPSPADATQVVWRSGPCPIGSDSVRVFSKVSENMLGGWDSDTATYSAEGQWRTHKIATCAESLFSVYNDDVPLLQPDEALQRRLDRVLATARAELANPDEPTVWERYRLAARIYAELGRTSLFMGDLWLEAGWTIRDSGVGYYEGLNGPETTRGLLDAGAKELARGLPPAQEKAVRFNLARVAHRGGYAAEREAHLAAYKALGVMSKREADAVGKLEAAAKLEPFYQREALRFFEEARTDATLTAAERARATYLVGDLHRRLGAPDLARPAYAAALEAPELDPKLAQMARYLLDSLGTP